MWLEIPDESKICLVAMQEKYGQTKSVQAEYKNAHISLKYKEKWKKISLILLEEDIPQLQQQQYDKYHDIVNGMKEELSPWQQVNHEIMRLTSQTS